VILYSENLEKSLAGVVKAGGKITKEPFAFPGGRRFHFHDPSGNELGVWSKK
jgi:predicted enzyme related to lactoylglutathione lyase